MAQAPGEQLHESSGSNAGNALQALQWRNGKAPQNDSMHHGGSFGRYMELKNQKLHEQFSEDQQRVADTNQQRSTIFQGITIHVNGLTNPSHQELKQLMALHGGKFANYYYKSIVTHVICDHLPDTKLKQLLKSKSATPIVRAAWVSESIAAGKLLPPTQFSIDRLSINHAQQRICATPEHNQAALAAADVYPQLAPTESAQPQSSAAEAQGARAVPAHQPSKPHTVPEGTSIQHAAAADQQPAPAPLTSQTPAVPAANEQHVVGAPQAIPAATALSDSPRGTTEAPQPQQPAVANVHAAKSWTPADIAAAQQTAARMRDACEVLKMAPRSSADDPNFMQTYFKASRLHFIGTWKMRIEALMAQKAGASQAKASAAKDSAQALFAGPPAKRAKRERVVMHVDMDCFFASVSVRNRPELRGIPLAVAHSNHAQGHSELSCVNYVARRAGVRADMWLAGAKAQCPDLVVIPYEFDGYQEVSETVYDIMLQHTDIVQPLSCDEAYLDVTGCGDPLELAARIRAQIAATGCTASIGIGPSLLVARIATKKAKPDGVFRIPPQEVDTFLTQQPVDALPGVGWSARSKLEALGIGTVAQLRVCDRARVAEELGAKTMEELMRFAWGNDDREVEVPGPRKSVGAEVNYGIRFSAEQDATSFITELAGEVENRMAICSARGRTVTLKLKRRKAGAPEPVKFLGHGIVDNVSRSVTLPSFISSAQDIAEATLGLFRTLGVPADQVKGVGIVVSKLSGSAGSAAAAPRTLAPAKGAAGPRSTFDPENPGPYEHFIYELEQVRPEYRASNTAPMAVPRTSPTFKGSKTALPYRPWVDPPPQTPAKARGSAMTPAADTAKGSMRDGAQQQRTASAAGVVGAASEAQAQPWHHPQPVDDIVTSDATAALEQSAPGNDQDGSAALHTGEEQPAPAAADDAEALLQPQAALPPQSAGKPPQHVSDAPAGSPVAEPIAQPAGPITAMPALDTLDMSVLDQLPAAMRLELMKAYGLHSTAAPTPRKPPARSGARALTGSASKRKSGGPSSGAFSRGTTPSKVAKAEPRVSGLPRARPRPPVNLHSRPASPGAIAQPAQQAHEPMAAAAANQHTTSAASSDAAEGGAAHKDAPKAAADPFQDAAAPATAPPPALPPLPCVRSAASRVAAQGLTLSQIDPGTLRELPSDVQQGILSTLPRSRAAFRQRNGTEANDMRGKPAFGNSLVHGAQGTKRAAKRAVSQHSAPEATHEDVIARLLQHCNEGGEVTVDESEDAQQVGRLFEETLQECVPCEHCRAQRNAGGAMRQAQHQPERFGALLKLQGAWLAWCLRQERFMFVMQACKAMLRNVQSHECAAAEAQRTHVRSVQDMCRSMHGFVIDVT